MRRLWPQNTHISKSLLECRVTVLKLTVQQAVRPRALRLWIWLKAVRSSAVSCSSWRVTSSNSNLLSRLPSCSPVSFMCPRWSTRSVCIDVSLAGNSFVTCKEGASLVSSLCAEICSSHISMCDWKRPATSRNFHSFIGAMAKASQAR